MNTPPVAHSRLLLIRGRRRNHSPNAPEKCATMLRVSHVSTEKVRPRPSNCQASWLWLHP